MIIQFHRKNNFENEQPTLLKIKKSRFLCLKLNVSHLSIYLYHFCCFGFLRHSFALKNKKSIRDGERRRPGDGYRTGFLPVLPALVCRAKSVAYPHCHISTEKCLNTKDFFLVILFVRSEVQVLGLSYIPTWWLAKKFQVPLSN